MKSHARDLLSVAFCVLKDAAGKCAANQLDRDFATMKSRVEHEGLSFLTITLPSFGKDLDRSLSNGSIAPDCFRSFKKRLKTPAFMQGFFELVFCKETGRLLDEPNISAIEGIRQVSNLFKKIELPCAPERVRKAFSDFQQCELDLKESLDPADIDYFVSVSNCLWPNVIGDGGPGKDSLNPLSCVPKHGPGATQERISGNRKYVHLKWHDRLEPYFPLLSFAYSSENACESSEFADCAIIQENGEEPVRVITVPKTLKSPRIIAIEPVCMQYAQQAISRALVKVLEVSYLTRGHVNFTDQSINQRLAMKSSADERSATLDLSSASDRVPYSLAIRMFDSNPDLQGAIQACRSKKAQVPSGDIISLEKFASMGSALCFPVEAMYFYTICIGALLRKRNLPVTQRNALWASRRVYVYGDDIIIPTDDAAVVAEDLQKYYCKVNSDKSFWNGKFRESCGVEAYNGEEVTPTYLRRLPPSNKRETKELISWVKASNHFYKKGYWQTASHLISRCESILGTLPIMGPSAAGLGKVSFQHLVSAERWNKDYHVFEVKTWCAVPVYHCDKLDGYPALMKCLLRLESNSAVPVDEKHLIRSARYGAVALKRRWVRPY